MPLPEIVNDPSEYGTVTWTGLVSMIDSVSDPDDLPDKAPVTGTIIFKPSAGALKFLGATPVFTNFLIDRPVNIVDAQVDEQGRKYVKLESNSVHSTPEAFTWTAVFNLEYQGRIIRVPDAVFALQPGQVLDLSTVISAADVTYYTPLQLSAAVEARQGAEVARDEAVSAAESVAAGRFDVKTFGAVGNGIHDDTEAIMEAITEAHDAGGGTVVFPAGTYRVWDSIGNGSELISNVKLVAPGNNTATILSNGNFPPLAGAFYRCNISGLTLDAGGHGAPAANIHMVETTLADCILDRWVGTGLRLNDGTYGDVGLLNYVVRNHIIQCNGIGIFQTYRWVDSWILDNNIGSTDANLSLEGGPLRVLGNHLNGAPVRNIDLRGNKRIIIATNILEGSREEAIRYIMPSWLAEDSPQVVISSNNFSNGGKAAAGVHPCIRIKGVSATALVEGFSIIGNLFACEDAGSGWLNIVLFENAKDSNTVGNQWEGAYLDSPIGLLGTTSGIESAGNTSGNPRKLDQSLEPWKVYGTREDNGLVTTEMITYTQEFAGWSLAQRGENGTLNVGTAVGPNHAVTKAQLEAAIGALRDELT